MQYMTYFRFTQIKRYFHVLALIAKAQPWHMKLSLLYEHLNKQFKAFYVLSQNVSVDKMIKAFTSRSVYTLKMLNKPIREGFKMQGLRDCRYIWHFLWYSRIEGTSRKPSFRCNLSANPYTGTAKLVANPNLSNTAFAVLQLAKTLLYIEFEFSLFNDNLFNKPELFKQLGALGIRACGTTCKDVTTLVFKDSLDN